MSMSTPINEPAGRERSHKNSAPSANDPCCAATASNRRYSIALRSKSQNRIERKNRIRKPISLFVVTITSLVGLLTSSSIVTSSANEFSEESAPVNLAVLEVPLLDTVDFSHARHVPPMWLHYNHEVKRDCTGCHDFSDPDPENWPSPMEACVKCHAFDSFTFSGTPSTDPASNSRMHVDHATQACSLCHSPVGAPDDVPKYMPIPVIDKQKCTLCHADYIRKTVEVNTEGSSRAERDAATSAILKLRDEKKDRPLPTFSHAQHLRPEQFTDSDSCEKCHVELSRSDADDLGDKQFDPRSCRTCHSTEFEVGTYFRPSNTAAAFLHEFHLNESALQVDKQLGQERCLRCHSFNDEKNTFGLRTFLTESEDMHDGCVKCHEHKDWKVENHGQTDKCSNCHAFQDGDSLIEFAGMATNRPTVKLLRPRPAAFLFDAHTHQQITVPAGESVDAKCAECHRANVPELPSLLSNRPFDHATHLSADLGELSKKACLLCHKEMEGETFADLREQEGAIENPDLLVMMIYEDTDCTKKCHGDGFETVLPENKERVVMWFDHKKHDSTRKHPKTGESINCLTCHVDSQDGSRFSVSIPEDVRNCTQCHSHEEHPEQTGEFNSELVNSCLDCHRFSPIPKRNEPIQVKRLQVNKKIGFESHANGGACLNCHAMNPEIVGNATPLVLAAPPTKRTIQGTRIFKIHKKLHPGFEEDNKYFNRGSGTDRPFCVDCHWQSQSRPFGKASAFKSEFYSGLSKPEIRDRFG
ncbi:MAG: hypothetical protein ACI8TQ_000838, partial [Planctomycetota bacterium]